MPKRSTFGKLFSTYLVQPVPQDSKDEEVLDCPFLDCMKEGHFYANCKNGGWHCKRCDRSGYPKALLTEVHSQWLEQTTDEQYSLLSEIRGISVEILRNAGFAYDHMNDRWLVPYYTYDPVEESWREVLNNLGYFYPSSTNPKARFTIKKAGALPLYLYNPGLHAEPPSNNAIICEGEWDTLAYYDANPDTEDLILGKPGAGFNVKYLETLAKTSRVDLLFDNDEGGRKQTARAVLNLEKATHSIKVRQLDWAMIPDAPKDVRDLWIDRPDDCLSQIESAIVPADTQQEPSEEEDKEIRSAGYATDISVYSPIETYDEYLRKLQGKLYTTPDTIKSMAAVFGITISIVIEGEPLWAFLIGPPSSGKTTLIQSFGGENQMFDHLSKITSTALVSGWVDDTGRESSYLNKLRSKTLFVKDFTCTLQEDIAEQRKLIGLLTDAFDGHVKVPFGNNTVKEFADIYFNMVAGVTDIVHGYSAASLGERFLRIDWLGQHYDSRQFAKVALANFGKKNPLKEQMTALSLGLVNHMITVPIVMEIETKYQEWLTDLGEFIALVRTKVEKNRFEGLMYKPRPELPARLTLQLAKLFVSVRTILNPDPDNEESTVKASVKAYDVIRKVALDTCYGFSLDMLRYILKNPGADRNQIAHGLGIGSQRAYRVLDDLITTGVLAKTSGRTSAKKGRPKFHYSLNSKLLAALEQDENTNSERRRRPHSNGSIAGPTRRTKPSKGRRRVNR